MEYNDIMEIAGDMDAEERKEFLEQNGIEVPEDYWVIVIKVEGGYAPFEVYNTKEEAEASRSNFNTNFLLNSTVMHCNDLSPKMRFRADKIKRAWDKFSQNIENFEAEFD